MPALGLGAAFGGLDYPTDLLDLASGSPLKESGLVLYGTGAPAPLMLYVRITLRDATSGAAALRALFDRMAVRKPRGRLCRAILHSKPNVDKDRLGTNTTTKLRQRRRCCRRQSAPVGRKPRGARSRTACGRTGTIQTYYAKPGSSFEPLIYKNGLFTKTGSGQT